MGRASTKENKNLYQTTRERLGYSRDAASELLAGLSSDIIESIESEKRSPRADEVVIMAEGYNEPMLCNYFCSNDCEIGKKYIPEVKTKVLSDIVLKMLASLNSTQDMQKRLIEITADGSIENEELEDFIEIQNSLEQISHTVAALQFWVEKKLNDGAIDLKKYNEIKNGQ